MAYINEVYNRSNRFYSILQNRRCEVIFDHGHILCGGVLFSMQKDDLTYSESFATLIEDVGIEDRLELSGHCGKLRLLHPAFLSLIEGDWGLDGVCQTFPEFQELRASKPIVDSLSPYL